MRPGLRSALDLFSVVMLAMLLIGVFLSCYLLAPNYGIPDTWVYVASLGVVSIVVIGRSVRSMFKHPLFLPYFALWAVLQTAGSALAVKEYGTILALPIMLFLLFVGYVVTFHLFGVPPDRKPGKKVPENGTPPEGNSPGGASSW